ncbi:germ cell nuclear acidic protein [Chanos chanos]|uniref:Germ cell nuclear acidic protein n=1 Tax=Chanos chanos TaxID=29144 RepID=A0A6J2X175_CHACN|nr:acidic repeat-containing protein-like [Chanos chanos]
MDADTQKLFQRVAAKLGWAEDGGLDKAEEQLRKSVKKTRRPAVGSSDSGPLLRKDPSLKIQFSESDDSEKENQAAKQEGHPNRVVLDSSDDDFDQYLAVKAAPEPSAEPPNSALRTVREPVPVLSSDSDDSFENFLSRVKTPQTQPRQRAVTGSGDSLKDFIVDNFSSDDDFVFEKGKPPAIKGHAKTPRSVLAAERVKRPPLSQCDSPVFLSDSNDDSDIVIKSTWKTRHARPFSQPSSEEHGVKVQGREPERARSSPLSCSPPPSLPSLPRRHAQTRPDDSGSSGDEFQTLLDRIKKNRKVGSQASPKPPSGPKQRPMSLSDPPVKAQRENSLKPVNRPEVGRTPVQIPRAGPVSLTEPRPAPTSRVAMCKTPGCFLQSLSNPGSSYSRGFKQNKEELTSKLYQLYNSSVFDSKLPSDMSVTWNKKLRKTAGICITGQERNAGSRYARIELSVKVCDSADRLRDTLVHEMCHAATWLINNVRDGHGPFWKIYARKATLAHPELPMVTRCHSYDINYKYQYQCNRCKNTIGRHSKSLDTQRFICALCQGQLVLLTPSKPRAATPFANFVKEHYKTARQELAGQSHAEVMRKLSADFASKTRLSQS